MAAVLDSTCIIPYSLFQPVWADGLDLSRLIGQFPSGLPLHSDACPIPSKAFPSMPSLSQNWWVLLFLGLWWQMPLQRDMPAARGPPAPILLQVTVVWWGSLLCIMAKKEVHIRHQPERGPLQFSCSSAIRSRIWPILNTVGTISCRKWCSQWSCVQLNLSLLWNQKIVAYPSYLIHLFCSLFVEELVKNVGEQEKDQSRNSTDAQLQEEATRIQNESSQGSDGTTCPPRSIVLQVVSFDTPLSDESSSEKCTNSDPNQKDLSDAQQETQNTDPLNGNASSQSTSQSNEAVQGEAAAVSGISLSNINSNVKYWNKVLYKPPAQDNFFRPV